MKLFMLAAQSNNPIPGPAHNFTWPQNYVLTGSWRVSVLLAALLLLLLTLMLGLHMKAHRASLITLAVAVLVTIGLFHMPVKLAVLGLAFARSGALYPFFGTLIGWIGTASTGSDTSSNVLFGSLQKLTAQQLGIAPVLTAAANSCGGVMGKMVAPQSLVVASTATGIYGNEGGILRKVLLHSIAPASLMDIIVLIIPHVPRLLHLLAP